MNDAARITCLLLDADDDERRFAAIVVLRNLDSEPETLLVQRAGPPEEGKWACPGGHAEEDEPMTEAAKRELEEETGVETDNLTFIEKKPAPGMDHGTVHIYFTIVDDNAKAKAGDDAGRVKWLKVEGLPELAFGNNDHVEKAVKRTQALYQSERR